MVKPNSHIIIVAAGSGSRFGGRIPKQFLDLQGLPVVIHTINALKKACPGVDMTLVISENHQDLWQELCEKHNFCSPQIVIGGTSRFESVKNALQSVGSHCKYILVHDGARPFVSKDLVGRLFYTLETCEAHGALPALPLTDSIRQLAQRQDGKMYSQAVDRNLFQTVQTPQLFHADILLKAYSKARDAGAFTDDASVVEAAGFHNISLSMGDRNNIKITHPIDFAIAALINELPAAPRH